MKHPFNWENGQHRTRNGQNLSLLPVIQGKGQSSPRKGQIETLPLVAVDWGGSAIYVTVDGKFVTVFRNLQELFLCLKEPSLIVVESTFESYSPYRRKLVMEAAAPHIILTLPTRQTGWERHRSKFKDDKCDFIDACVIYKLARSGRVPLKVPALPLAQEETFDQHWQYLRRSGQVKKKHPEVQAVLHHLPKYKILPKSFKLALGNGKEYSLPFVTTMFQAASHAATREQFERLIGAYAHGYPGYYRATFVRRYWCRHKQVSWRQFRKATRMLYHNFKSHGQGKIHPEKGSSYPDRVT